MPSSSETKNIHIISDAYKITFWDVDFKLQIQGVTQAETGEHSIRASLLCIRAYVRFAGAADLKLSSWRTRRKNIQVESVRGKCSAAAYQLLQLPL